MKRRNLSSFSPIQAPNPAIRRCFGTGRVINHHFSAFGTDFSLCGRPSPTKNSRHACQVVSSKGKSRLGPHLGQSSEPGFSQPTHGLGPTKYFLDPFAYDQTCLVSGMPGGTTINSASLGFFCYVGGDPMIAHCLYKSMHIVPFVRSQGRPAFSDRANHHGFCRFPLSGSGSMRGFDIHCQSIPVFQ